MQASLLNSPIPQRLVTCLRPYSHWCRFWRSSKTSEALVFSYGFWIAGPARRDCTGNDLRSISVPGPSLLDSRVLGSCTIGNALRYVHYSCEVLDNIGSRVDVLTI